ncbi:hypothetical protein M407DRAFT_7058 [Tulasnella calospora MUT 4182]|uniref:Uncharacterized protein n=1 Tax=Tulasnella calospora MUT 4182 TaxID=1051891 RepID=A0A0C3L2K4_9AGAM|nr:hypothetical protein M407DRAFT_7058 [Tulasnella calospora MUT 4182]
MPPWIQSVHNPLPRSLYPILPPPTPYYAPTKPVTMFCSSSTTSSDSDTAMMDTQDYEEGETLTLLRTFPLPPFLSSPPSPFLCLLAGPRRTPLDSTNVANYNIASCNIGTGGSGVNIESDVDDEESSSEWEFDPESEDETFNITCNKTNPSTAVEGNQRKKASASDSNSPAKRTRSSARSQQPKARITGYHEVEMVPLEGTKKFHHINS